MKKPKKVKILYIDIETAPILANLWGLFDQNVGLNQIAKDWHLLSFAAQWEDSSDIIYHDQSKKRNLEDDKALLKKMWKLLNEADVVIGHNSKKFDTKKINARFLKHKLGRPAPYRQIDTLVIARKHFACTSNKLEYLSNLLCPELKKSSHKKYPGFELWKQCLAKNQDAFNEMEKYNKQDIVALRGVYNVLKTWDNTINFSLYSDSDEVQCNCGSEEFQKRGFAYTNTSKFQRYQCVQCNAWFRGRENLSKNKGLLGI